MFDIPEDSDVKTSTGKEATKSFADSVNEVVNNMKQDDNGNFVLPEGEYSEELKYAAMAEKRRRDTQSAFGKGQNTLKAIEKENEKLRKLLVPQLELTTEQKEELQDLQNTDPVAWRVKLQGYEAAAQTKLDEQLSNVSKETAFEVEVARRAEVLEQFTKDNPGYQMNDDVLANDVPPRIKDKLANGDISFEEFLEETKEFFSKGKTVIGKETEEEEEPNLNESGGGSTATKQAVEEDINKSYATEIY